MRLRRLEISNFRGIASLDWRGVGDTAALVGPGDSCKSTVLDAIERVLSPRWNLQFDDADFFALRTTVPIQIRATVTDFPASFLRETKFGLAVCELLADGTTAAPKKQSTVFALIIQLQIDASLEPIWCVVDSEGREHAIAAKDREVLGMIRVGSYVDSHLGWSRASALTRLTERSEALGLVLAEASRSTRRSFSTEGLEKLKEASLQVQETAAKLGVTTNVGLVPHLDVGAVGLNSGALSLHDGEIPLRKSGLGTRRLLAMAMQTHVGAEDGLALVDELENGLEPYRIRKLLRVLRGRPPEEVQGVCGQFIFTTHSPTVLSELTPTEVFVVRRSAIDGTVSIQGAAAPLATILAKAPVALLSRRVIVGEGATEVGFIRALADHWESAGEPSFAYRAVEVVDGLGGNQPATIAGSLSALGYATAVLVDSDANDQISRAGDARILQWPSGVSIEERLARDLPQAAFIEMVELAARSPKAKSSNAVRDAVAAAVNKNKLELGDEPSDWVNSVADSQFRVAFGRIAKSSQKGWFKTEQMGYELGAIVSRCLGMLDGSDIEDVVLRLHAFVYDD